MNKKILPILLALALLAGVFFVFPREKPPKPGLVKIKDYVYVEEGGISCQAFMPECGMCFGDVIQKECWVDPKALDESEKSIMGIR